MGALRMDSSIYEKFCSQIIKAPQIIKTPAAATGVVIALTVVPVVVPPWNTLQVALQSFCNSTGASQILRSAFF
jgi:hypothetical protein